MKFNYKNSKVLPPLMLAFILMGMMVMVVWYINDYFSQRIYDVFNSHSSSSDKMLIIISLIETARHRTRLTGQMLTTKDIFDRDEITLQLDIDAAKFARLREKLLELPLSRKERNILKKQDNLIAIILPMQRAAAELAMSDEESDLEKANKLLYENVLPGQTIVIDYFMQLINDIRNDVITSSREAINTHKRTNLIKQALTIAFFFVTILVATVTIRRIVSFETNINKVNIELNRLNLVKSDFVSLVSHELRTPLTSIKSFAEILLDDIENMDIETQKRYLSIIDSEGDRLTRLVTNILDLQKIDANKMEWNDEYILLNEIVQQSVDFFRNSFHEKNIDLSIATTPEELAVMADADKLKQVVFNLLSNALKFTEKGYVLISVYQYKIKSINDGFIDMARVSVSDTGLGIPKDQLFKVFESFHQVDNSATRSKGGSGLGLDICRKIINHYEGNIWVESEVGKGSVFCFEIPLVRAKQKKIGETLIELGMITNDQLEIALVKQIK